MRASATPGTVRALMDMNSLVDVRALLPSLTLPTMLLHRTGDQLCPVDGSRWMAGQIAGATMIELEGDDHFVSGNPDQILDAIEPFITSTPKPPHHMALAAVVHAAGLAAEDLTRVLVDAGGRRRHAAGGEVVVLFDGPATAVRAVHAALRRRPRRASGSPSPRWPWTGGRSRGRRSTRRFVSGAGRGPGELLVSRTAGVLLGLRPRSS